VTYDVEAEEYNPRRARRRRALITLAVVSLMLFFAFWYAYSYYRNGDTRPTATTPVCTTKRAAPTPADVAVNVYNATDRSGLAARRPQASSLTGCRPGRPLTAMSRRWPPRWMGWPRWSWSPATARWRT